MATNPRGISAYKRLAAEMCKPREGARCWICRELIVYHLRPRNPQGPSLDHVVPLAVGGSLLDPSNARLAHYGCNSNRGTKTIHATRNRAAIWGGPAGNTGAAPKQLPFAPR